MTDDAETETGEIYIDRSRNGDRDKEPVREVGLVRDEKEDVEAHAEMKFYAEKGGSKVDVLMVHF